MINLHQINFDDPTNDDFWFNDFWDTGEVDDTESAPQLGPCCICGEQSAAVRNILILNHPGPTPGKGWGCFQCGLPQDGAMAVLCDSCLDLHQSGKQKLAYICTGYPATDGRTPYAEMSQEPFEHDMSLHNES